MILLHKRPISEEMAAWIADNVQEHQRLTDAGADIPRSLADRYKHPEIKASLLIETSHKCAYCESKMLHVDFGDVEHIRPKVLGSLFRFDYRNLTIACGLCNNFKHDHEDVIDPYLDDPNGHFFALGPMILRRPDSDLGLSSELRLQLNRPQLLERRLERLTAVARLFDVFTRANNEVAKAVLLDQIRQECEPSTEYSFVVNGYVDTVNRQIGRNG